MASIIGNIDNIYYDEATQYIQRRLHYDILDISNMFGSLVTKEYRYRVDGMSPFYDYHQELMYRNAQNSFAYEGSEFEILDDIIRGSVDFEKYVDIEFSDNVKKETIKMVLPDGIDPISTPEKYWENQRKKRREVNPMPENRQYRNEYPYDHDIDRRTKASVFGDVDMTEQRIFMAGHTVYGEYYSYGPDRKDGKYGKIVLYYAAIGDAMVDPSISYYDYLSIVLAHEMFHCLHDISTCRFDIWRNKVRVCCKNLDKLGFPNLDKQIDIVPIIKESTAAFFELEWAGKIYAHSYVNYRVNKLLSSHFFYPYKHSLAINDMRHLACIVFFNDYEIIPRKNRYWRNALRELLREL